VQGRTAQPPWLVCGDPLEPRILISVRGRCGLSPVATHLTTFPQLAISHQRRLWFLVSSMNSQ